MSISAFDHPYLSGLIGDNDTASWFSVDADIAAILAFESALARAEADQNIIDSAAADAIETTCRQFLPDMASLRAAVAIDGVVIPEFVRQLRDALAPEHRAFVHFGATSQDVIDTSLMIRLKPLPSRLDADLAAILQGLDHLDSTFGNNSLMAHTRMQAAIAIAVRDRVASWRAPILRHQQRLSFLTQHFPCLQFGGAAGTLDKLGDKAPKVRSALADILGLKDLPQWHNQRDIIVELCDLLAQISGSLGKIAQDICLLAQGVSEISLSGGGKSSAMPHKQNPVLAEVLVALARFNATQVSGMHHALVHEQERSGAAWTLEWMILPSMVAATAGSLRRAGELLGAIEAFGFGTSPDA
ncbi:MAG: 3-carboxy-cis,cis-muconate cycloisomerase [Phyllobacterium sp.]|uniref:3-carboxy-cis,cis-muconate cycloisomerase n=1 Tax=Phyllobacterium sp. TaxID=1871046 RepID=UPI0030F05948